MREANRHGRPVRRPGASISPLRITKLNSHYYMYMMSNCLNKVHSVRNKKIITITN